MVMPGVTIRKPLVKRPLWGWRTALIVCQAISMAITVVLPAPVASLRAMRDNSGLASRFTAANCWLISFALARALGATSVSQMMVSAASTWQKKGRIPLKR